MTRLVIHADDVAMCHGANVAFAELARLGTITSGSIMVPCPWFPEIAEIAAAEPDLDIGVHLTLNAEKARYRWGPLTPATPASGLTDPDGYFWADVASLRRHAHPDAVEAEWRAQVDRALAAGIAVTHLDAHMGSALAPEWCHRYLGLARDYGVPVLITRTLGAYGPCGHLAGVTEEEFAPFVAAAVDAGLPVFDRVLETDFGRPADRAPAYEEILGAITEDDDLVFCAFHPNAPGPGEIEVIDLGNHHVRTDEHRLFGSPEWQAWLDRQPFTLTAMRDLRPATHGA